MGQASFVLEVQELLEGQVDGKRDRFAVTNMKCKSKKKNSGGGFALVQGWSGIRPGCRHSCSGISL